MHGPPKRKGNQNKLVCDRKEASVGIDASLLSFKLATSWPEMTRCDARHSPWRANESRTKCARR